MGGSDAKALQRSKNLVETLSGSALSACLASWELWARPEQLPPPGDWTTWLLMGGRGAGKTRAGAEWVRSIACGARPVSPIALVGETLSEAQSIMVEGESGLLAISPKQTRPRFDRSRGKLYWPNGAEGQLMSGSDPERFRGPQFAAAWSDETAKWPNAEAAWDMLQFALRLGERPRQLVTTTPRPTPLIRRLMADPQTVVTRVATKQNAKNLAPGFLSAVVGRYEGSVLGRQELDGELIEDLPDALWQRATLEAVQIASRPELERIVIAVDPPVTAHAGSDGCGIIAAGLSGDKAVVLSDKTLKPAPPLGWARTVKRLYDALEADAVVAEINQGGDLVTQMLKQIDPQLPVLTVRATRGKWVRAEPVAALYEQGRVRHLPGLSALEDEMCQFGADGLSHGHSPDRVDALVWALTELMLNRAGRPRVRRA